MLLFIWKWRVHQGKRETIRCPVAILPVCRCPSWHAIQKDHQVYSYSAVWITVVLGESKSRKLLRAICLASDNLGKVRSAIGISETFCGHNKGAAALTSGDV
jgi:hypothetical protein